MITCDWLGQCGNNMFQAAATIGAAKKHGVGYHIPANKYFEIESDAEPPNAVTYREPRFEYDPIPVNGNTRLHGYFQSPKYFEHCRDEILRAFGFRGWYEPGTVCIQVRRGDYLQLDCHPVQPESYYHAAIRFFARNLYTRFMVVSDDIPWCESAFATLPYEFEYMDNRRFRNHNGRHELNEIQAMSFCEHHIISNSTYGWWAAWLNQNPNKIVITPKDWFSGRKAGIDTSDLIPETWLRM